MLVGDGLTVAETDGVTLGLALVVTVLVTDVEAVKEGVTLKDGVGDGVLVRVLVDVPVDVPVPVDVVDGVTVLVTLMEDVALGGTQRLTVTRVPADVIASCHPSQFMSTIHMSHTDSVRLSMVVALENDAPDRLNHELP